LKKEPRTAILNGMETSDEHGTRFSFALLGFLYFGWFAYLLAMSEFFFRPLLIVGAALFGIGIIRAMYRWLRPSDWSTMLVLTASIILAACIGYFTEPTILSGRDQGSFSTAALELVQNGKLPFSSKASDAFFSIYGPGKALNFPGFFYLETGELYTQFPLGYTAWLGAFIALFGTAGMVIGNGVLLVLSLMIIFSFLRLSASKTFSLFGFALAAVSFLPTWFAKFTLSENLALFLFLFLSFNLTLFLRRPAMIPFLGTLLSGTLLAITRVEGFAILPVALALLYLSKNGKSFISENRRLRWVLPLSLIPIVLIMNISSSIPFFRTIAKALLQNFGNFGNETIAGNGSESFSTLWSVFFAYGLAPLFILGFFGALVLIRKKRWISLIPFILAVPTLFYFIDPSITFDHPWMLRRYLPTLWPALLLTAVLGIASVFPRGHMSELRFPRARRQQAIIIVTFGILFLSELPTFIRYVAVAENTGIIRQAEDLTSTVGGNDLLLIDRDATGSPYAIPTEPLRAHDGKNAVYFFNAADLKRLPRTSFDHIYLLAPTEKTDIWKVAFEEPLLPIRSSVFSTMRVETLPFTDIRLPDTIRTETESTLFIIGQ
jgi:hypothetical protein